MIFIILLQDFEVISGSVAKGLLGDYQLVVFGIRPSATHILTPCAISDVAVQHCEARRTARKLHSRGCPVAAGESVKA
ncbi:hypothetical protein MMON_53310 [Mycolicibacterium monacense]|uniref:Uncharacterized protein n=1 Tax=Mycolicibacterium monacense TaxID=85693 RepID=A0AAD1N2G5_MYCMB|nr:hypothetical protein MMON_53310 [Mycolicibacterium monacense]